MKPMFLFHPPNLLPWFSSTVRSSVVVARMWYICIQDILSNRLKRRWYPCKCRRFHDAGYRTIYSLLVVLTAFFWWFFLENFCEITLRLCFDGNLFLRWTIVVMSNCYIDISSIAIWHNEVGCKSCWINLFKCHTGHRSLYFVDNTAKTIHFLQKFSRKR